MPIGVYASAVNDSSAPVEALPLDPIGPPDAAAVPSPPRPIRLIALDVDGTFVDPAGHIAPRTALAIRAARTRGVEVIIATGRTFSEGIQALSAYAFSNENWLRSPEEVRFVMGFNRGVIRRRRDALHALGARMR